MIRELIEKIRKTAPVVAGLDPMLSYIPEQILRDAFSRYGETPEGAAEAVLTFNKALIDALCDIVPAVKPQIAMYEQFGVPGVAAFRDTVNYAHEKGMLVIGDIKRGDIGSTSAAYAAGHLGKVTIGNGAFEGFAEDFATVNPYLGSDGVRPFLDVCRENDKGIFVLVKTSNPSSGELQDRVCDGKPVYRIVAEMVNSWAEEMIGEDAEGFSPVGAVVGATYPEMAESLREVMPHSYILVPGYGAQGGSGKDLKPFFRKDGLGAIVNSSRGIIAAWKKEAYASYGAARFDEAARAAALDMIEDIHENI